VSQVLIAAKGRFAKFLAQLADDFGHFAQVGNGGCVRAVHCNRPGKSIGSGRQLYAGLAPLFSVLGKGFVKWRMAGCSEETKGDIMTRESALTKIHKLLAMADKNSGATENEMLTATSIAQTLMARYHLSESSIQGYWRSKRSGRGHACSTR